METFQVEVVVVGAGTAGISAAHCLYLNGVENVVILEGSNRIGGRICTTQLGFPPKSIIELGANWIHGGCSENPVYAFMQRKRLLPRDKTLLNRRSGDYYTEDGVKIDRDISLRAYDIFRRIDEEASLYRHPSGTPEVTIEDFFNKRLGEELISFLPHDRKMAEVVFNCLKNYLSFHIGDRAEMVSLSEYWRYKEMSGGDVKLPCGYMAMVEALAEEFPRSWLKLNNRVTRIEWNQGKDRHAIVHSDKGKSYQCRFVIVTASVGYLKLYQNTLFKPLLPFAKQQAIERIGFGRVDKIFLFFEKPFWKPDEDLSIRLAVETREKNTPVPWYEYIFAFDSVYTNPYVLVCWISGPGAEQMEKLDIEEVKRQLLNTLRRFTGNHTIPAPKSLKRSTWCSDPLINGSYSYLAMGNDGTENETLAEPLPSKEDPLLLFAGEATHPWYFSTVHGAMITGIREAERIIHKRQEDENQSRRSQL